MFEDLCLWLEDNNNIMETFLASGKKTFRLIVESYPVYQELCQLLQDKPIYRRKLWKRIYHLMEDLPPEYYAHPHDHTIAIYLLALKTVPKDSLGLFWTLQIEEKE